MIFNSLDDVVAAEVPLILPDTCILLDILRSPRRDSVDARSIESAKNIVEAVNNTGKAASALANQVHDELQDNQNNVQEETKKSLRKLQQELRRIDGWSSALGEVGRADISHGLTAVSQCEVILSNWVAASLREPTTDELTGRAHRRMMKPATPARRGKDSSKDCLVVETYLKLARDVRAKNYSAPIVFASSNTADYLKRPGSKLHADIADEFEAVGIIYARTLHEAAHLLGLNV